MGDAEQNIVNPDYIPQPISPTGYRSFEEFYPFYLGEHRHIINRRLHLLGTGIASSLIAYFIIWKLYFYIPLSLIPGYMLAWIGHFFFEKNRPATFKHPFYSLMGDIRMFYEVISGQRRP